MNISNDQIEGLTEMGFVWDTKKEIPFNNRLEDLKHGYKTKHGNCNMSLYHSEEKYVSSTVLNWADTSCPRHYYIGFVQSHEVAMHVPSHTLLVLT